MSERQHRTPDSTHPIEIVPHQGRVVVSRNGAILADSARALTLREANLNPVQYIPLEDVETWVLQHTDHTTYCPYKGEASYYSIDLEGDRADNAVWCYPEPYESVAAIAGHVAFYPDSVVITES